LHIIRQGLALRKAHPALFHGAEYRPLQADSGFEENVIAFSLGGQIVAVAPRLFARQLGDAMAPIGSFWRDARLDLPEGEFTDVLTGARHAGGPTPIAKLLAEFPVALLISA
jgi:(1->4)-alpha-D-glucan 1-alpha-D-glucosylmutase